jgi:hypothetical protein
VGHRRGWRYSAAGLGLGLLAGCGAGWHRVATVSPGEWPPRQQVQVWSGTRSYQWHALVVTADSVTGIPFTRPVDCAGCRGDLPRGAVDSVRAGRPVVGFWKSFGLVIGGAVAILALVCGSHGGCSPGN